MAQQYFPNENNPIGQRVFYDASQPRIEIVGVVDNVKEGPLDESTHATIYTPFDQEPHRSFYVLVRTSQAEDSLLPVLSTVIHQIDPRIITLGEQTMVERIHDSSSAYIHRSSAYLVGGFATLALLLGVVGLYGVVAYSVGQRTREIGVRMALGAQRSSVYQLVLKEASWLTGMGIAIGLACSIGAATLMRKLLFATPSWDASTLLAVAATLAGAALLASYVPARRAASVNPVDALRAE